MSAPIFHTRPLPSAIRRGRLLAARYWSQPRSIVRHALLGGIWDEHIAAHEGGLLQRARR